MRRSTASLAAGRRPIVLGGTGLYLRAALADLDLRPPPPGGGARAPGVRAGGARRARTARRAAPPRALGGRRDRPERPPAHRARAGAAGRRRARAAAPSAPSSGPSTRATRRCSPASRWSARRCTHASTPAWTRWCSRARARRCARRTRPARRRPRARRWGFAELLAGDVEAMKRHTRSYARRQLTWMRKLAGVHVIDVTGREAPDVAADLLGLVGPRPQPRRSA